MNNFLSFPVIKAQISLKRLNTPAKFLTPENIIARDEYLDSQNKEFMSLESDHEKWRIGQERFISSNMSKFERDNKILDIACGDGVGLKVLAQMGFSSIQGVDSNIQKIDLAKLIAPARVGDMHDLTFIESQSVDIIMCSHSLEHCYDPALVLAEFHRILSPNGYLLLVLPYPDFTSLNERAHLAKYILGLHKFDHGYSVRKFVKYHGFTIQKVKFDSYREDEIWITAKRR